MVRLHLVVLGVLFGGLLSAQTPYEIGQPAWQEIWVDPAHGNDSATGAARAEALQTLRAAWGRIPARQPLTVPVRIRLVPGVYTDVPFVFESRWGTESAPVLIEAVEAPVTIPQLTISDSRYLYLMGLHVKTAASCEDCDHLLLRQSVLAGGLDLRTSRHVYLEQNTVDGGLELAGVRSGHLLRNTLRHATGACLSLHDESAGLLVDGNEIHGCDSGMSIAQASQIRIVNQVVHH